MRESSVAETVSTPEQSPAGESKTAKMSVQDLLLSLAGSDLQQFRQQFKRAREISPNETIRACLRYFAEHSSQDVADEAARIMLLWVAYTPNYVPLLIDPSFLSLNEAEQVARILRDGDPTFFVKLQGLAQDANLPYPHFLRAMALVETIANARITASWLRSFLEHPQSRISSKAAKTLCESIPNFPTVERLLKSKDARVRANAIEALWTCDAEAAVWIFKQALSDPSHRVVVNALVGLYRRNVEGALDKLIALTSDTSAMVRCAAAWGLGEIGDPGGIPALAKLATEDRAKAVRFRALHSLAACNAARFGLG